MYIIMAVIGSCLTGARATSHAFFNLRVSVSSVVGAARTVAFLEEICFWLCQQSIGRIENGGLRTLLPVVDVKPIGSGILFCFCFDCGGLCRSSTH